MNEVLARESIRKFHFSLLSNYISLSFFIACGTAVQPSSTGEGSNRLKFRHWAEKYRDRQKYASQIL